MKSTIIFFTTILLVINLCFTAQPPAPASRAGVALRKANVIKEFLGRSISNIWNWMRSQNEDTFVGRCFGMARKLKMLMPVIIFKLGVIVTTLAFLTLFSLKSLGLLVLLVIMNISGFAAKLAVLITGNHGVGGNQHKAQNIHFHIHQSKSGHYSVVPGDEYYERSDEMNSGGLDDSFYNHLKKFDMKYDTYR